MSRQVCGEPESGRQRRRGPYVPHRTEKRPEANSIGTQERVEINALGAKWDAEPAERSPLPPAKRRVLAPDLDHRYASERVDELKDEPTSDSPQRQGARGEKRRQPALDLGAHELLEALAHLLARLSLQEIAGERFGPRGHHLLAGRQTPDATAAPAQHSRFIDREGLVRVCVEKPRAGGD